MLAVPFFFMVREKEMYHLLPDDINPMVPETIQCSEVTMEKKRWWPFCCSVVSSRARGLASIQVRRLVDHRIHVHLYFVDGRCATEVVDLVTVMS